MVGTGWGIGSPVSQFGQATLGTSPYGVNPFVAPFTQSPPSGFGIGQPFGVQAQPYAQPLQHLLQILPQQLAQLNYLLQQQLQGLQQVVQIVPQQLHHIQQLLQILPQQIQMQSHTQQPFGAQGAPGFGSFGPWQQPNLGFSSQAFTGQGGTVM